MNEIWGLMIFPNIGFKAETDGLLTVTSCTSYESLHNPQEARRLHTILAEQTSIFGHLDGGPPERYLFVLVSREKTIENMLSVQCHVKRSSGYYSQHHGNYFGGREQQLHLS